MGVPGNANALLLASAAGGAYQITRSLRFNAPDSAYLSRTPSVAGNRKTWTWAGWVKRSGLGTDQGLIEGFVNSNAWTTFFVNSSNELQFQTFANGSLNLLWKTVAVFRDPSAWYHVVITNDTTQASSSNAVKIYVNGIQQTLTTTFSTGSYLQNRDLDINSTASQRMGVWGFTNTYLSGYLADVHFIDGQALDPSSFTETDATTGQLIPKAYTGSYGTNGAQLNFADNSSNTATTLGKDTSGNGNNWTPNNLSVTAGAGNDSLVDVPTNGAQTDTGAGGEVRGNYCTLNPLHNPGGSTLSNGNLDCTTASTGWGRVVGSIAVSSGKWYWEILAVNTATDLLVGIAPSSEFLASALGYTVGSYAYINFNGNKVNNSSLSSYGSTWTANDVIGVALDLDAGTLVFYKNGVGQGTAFSGLSGSFVPAVSDGGTGTSSFTANFGQRPFAYTAPSGFKALNTANLPAPVVTKPSDLFDVKLWTGNSSTQSISNINFSPDFVWIKCRNSSVPSHCLFDTIRGATKGLHSNETVAEWTAASTLTAFNSDGFSLGNDGFVNDSARTYAAWAWDAGSSTVTNTQGSISSQVRANASAGFSVVTYTGNGTTGTVGHGLGVAPGMVIIKSRSDGAANWTVWHSGLTNGYYIYLNTTGAQTNTSASQFFGNTSTTVNPSSTVITLGGANAVNNSSPATYVAYCFAPVAGYSAFGSYTGNGTTNRNFIYTGFTPRTLIVKRTSSSGTNWRIIVPGQVFLSPNTADSEYASLPGPIQALANGFEIFGGADINDASQTYIYAAFAESPFGLNNRAR
jgi:hypothetical protein